MTSKFKQAVQAVVTDGVVTSEERAILKQIAKQEGVSETDAEIYIIQQLKKQKVKMNRGESWFSKNSGTILNGVISIGTVVLGALLAKNNNNKK